MSISLYFYGEVSIMSCLLDDKVVRFYQGWAVNGAYKSSLITDEEEHASDNYVRYRMNLGSDDKEFASGDYLSESRYIVIQMERCFSTFVYEINDKKLQIICGTLKDDLPLGPCEIYTEESWMIFEEVTKAVQFIHHKGIIHRDLKPDNFHFGSNGRVKVCDLGHACWARSKICELKGTPERGTLLYIAPELDEGPVTYKVDIYSLGVIVLDLFHAFSTIQEKDSVLRQLREDVYPTGWKGDNVFLKKLTALCPDRPSTDEILEYIANRRLAICAQD